MTKEILSSVNLIPAETDIETVSSVIKDLANRYGTTPYTPHITIWGNVTAPISEVENAVRKAIEGIKPFTVDIEGLGHSPRWSRTLFATIKPHESLDELYGRLGERLRVFGDYDFSPHLSLAYKEEMTEEERLKELSQVVIPNQLKLDSIAVTTPTDPKAKWRNVSMWVDLLRLNFSE